MDRARTTGGELRPMIGLATPVVLAELGWMGMGVVDTLMVGRLGPEALGGVGVTRAIWTFCVLGGLGVLLSLDAVVAQAFGRGRRDLARRYLAQGTWLAIALAVPMTVTLLFASRHLDRLGIEPGVAAHGAPYLAACSFAMLPMLLYTAFRRYLQATDRTLLVMVALLSANLVNALFDWVLIFGRFGLPRLGAAGAGWATVASMTYLTAVLALGIRFERRGSADPPAAGTWRVDAGRLWTVVKLGLPASGQLLLEVGVITITTLLAARFAAEALAAHQVALTLASVTYMVPLGISAAAAVRVGHAIGRGDVAAARRAGWVAIGLAAAVMTGMAAIFAAVPATLVGLFSADPAVVASGVSLLYLAALFQLFDGVQVTAIGALRGSGRTLGPMVWNLVGWWIVGLPLGAFLAFRLGHGVRGLWAGLTAALVFMGIVMLGSWRRASYNLTAMDDSLTLRPATADDAERLLDWRNDPATRAASHDAGAVDRDRHLRWLERTLADPARDLWIVEEDGEPVGTVRVDREATGAELSWTVAPGARGRGVGKRMVRLAASRVQGPLRAEVKTGNEASARIAIAAGFERISESGGVVHFARTPTAGPAAPNDSHR